MTHSFPTRRSADLAALRFIEAMTVAGHGPGSEESVSGGKLLSQVPVRLVDDFLREYDNCRDSVLSDTGPIRKYIASRAEDELTEWDILLASRSENGERSEEHTSELQSLMRISYAVFWLKKKK